MMHLDNFREQVAFYASTIAKACLKWNGGWADHGQAWRVRKERGLGEWHLTPLKRLVAGAGFEPATFGLGGKKSS